MPVLLVRQRAEDYVAWRALFDQHAGTLRAYGSAGGRVFRSAVDPHEIWVLLDWDDLERARLFARSDDLREVMARAGSAGQPEVWLLADDDGPRG